MEKSAVRNEDAGGFMKFGKHGPGGGNRRREQEGEIAKPGALHSGRSAGCSSPGKEDGGVLVLAEKMKELELMDLGDVEHVLDLEEALHCYSLLTSPVFLDIVHKFFMEIYSEFSTARSSSG